MEPIKLRNLNLAATKQESTFAKDEKVQTHLIDPLRKPEPAVIQSRRARRLSIGYSNLKDLNEVREEFIAPSPSLERTLALSRERIPYSSKPVQLCDGSILQISNCDDFAFEDRGFDCQPFFHSYNYESRYGRDNYEYIINRLVHDDMNNKRPIFQKELEFIELKKMVTRTDYILFYLLGVDRLGYFKLKQEREFFHHSLYEAYTSSLRYNDNGSSDSDNRTADDDSSSTAHMDDVSDDLLSMDPPV